MKNKISTIQETVYKSTPVFFQNILCTIIGYKNDRERYGIHFERFYNLLKQQEFDNEVRLRDYQQTEFNKLINHCYKNIHYYKKEFDKRGIDPQTITLDNLNSIPILNKDIIKTNLDAFLAINYSKKELIPMHTSGTTGSGLNFFVCKEAWEKEYAMVWARRRPYSIKKEAYLTFSGRSIVPLSQNKPPFFRYNYYGKQILFSQYHMNDENLLHYFNAINNMDYKYFQGYPSTIYILANYMYEKNLRLSHNPSIIYTSSETLFQWQREVIEKVFECKVYDSYGTSELTSIFSQCDAGNYHENYEYGFTEFVPLDHEGELVRCEVISTGFLNYAFPLLRYKVNDCVLIDRSIKQCACGRTGTVIKRIEGRMEDIIVTPEGNRIGRLDHIFKDITNIKESQVIQEDIYNVTLNIVKRPGYNERDEKLLLNEFYNRISQKIKLDLKYIDHIERTHAGKFKAVISKLPNKGWRLS